MPGSREPTAQGESTVVNRRRVLATLGVGATGSALGLSALSGTAAAHDLRVEFQGCQELIVVVNDPDEFGVLTETIHVFDAERGAVRPVEIELTPENTAPIPGQFDGKPVLRARSTGRDQIVAFETGDGRRFENPHDCPRPEAPDEERPTSPARGGPFALEQGERCIPLTPLQYQSQTVEEFYGYTPDVSAANPRQSNTPTNVEEPGTSRLFLFSGPQGLSLVILHGGDGDPGGAASFEITGLPPAGEWVVLDDSHEGSQDVFETQAGRSEMHWAWGLAGRNDGGAFRGLGGGFEVRIDAAFGEAAMREPLDGADVNWQVLSGDARNPEVTDLDEDRPVTIRSGGC